MHTTREIAHQSSTLPALQQAKPRCHTTTAEPPHAPATGAHDIMPADIGGH